MLERVDVRISLLLVRRRGKASAAVIGVLLPSRGLAPSKNIDFNGVVTSI